VASLRWGFFFSLTSRAQERWSWPEKAKNLQVLPKDMPGSKLGPIMGGFARALGVRCWYCHMGQKGKPLSTYDLGDRALNNFGYQVLAANDVPGAIRVFELNAKHFPKSPIVWGSLAEAYMKAGNSKKPKQYYGKVLRLDPRNEKAKEMLKKIKEGGGK
jgi:tetratricopeptide (TPR) repeat protein